MIIHILAGIGVLISLYTAYIEYQHKKNKNYHAACDLSKGISCSTVVTSKYGKVLGISNSIPGLAAYLIIFILTFFSVQLVFYASILAALSIIPLAYLQYYQLKNFCVLCTIIYIVNIGLLVSSWLLL